MARKVAISYSVEKEVNYEVVETPQKPLAERAMALAPAEAGPEIEKSAVWIVHGMGQQIPYATLDQLNQGICIGAAAEGIRVSDPRFREIKVGNTIAQRVEVTLTKQDGTQKELHLYESYWAPKTEGVASLKSVIGFLWDGGSRGLINWATGFHRALFGYVVNFDLKWTVPINLLFTLLVLAALVAINAIILATGATWIGLGRNVKIPGDLAGPLTAIAGVAAAAGVTFGVLVFMAQFLRPLQSGSQDNHKYQNIPYYARLMQYLTWSGLILTCLAFITGAFLMAVILWFKCVPEWLNPANRLRIQFLINTSVLGSLVLLLVSLMLKRQATSHGKPPREGWFRQVLFVLAFAMHVRVLVGVPVLAVGSTWLIRIFDWAFRCMPHWLNTILISAFWVWPFLVIVSSMVRTLLVQYVGDVTVYVASNKIDKYDQVRRSIKDAAKESALAVYSLKDTQIQNGENLEKDTYDQIVVVGHSLGSVIAYDTLNRLIADDKLENHIRRVVDRTAAFITFGSPLDKTAFFFSVMGRDTLHVREELASVVQPMIRVVDVRTKIPWVNVYSKNDIICGNLDFYEFPSNMTPQDFLPGKMPVIRKVENVVDDEALVPLVAHVEYWENKTVWKELLKKL